MFFTQKHKKEENWAKLCKKLIFQVCTLLCILISFRKLRAPESWPEHFFNRKIGHPLKESTSILESRILVIFFLLFRQKIWKTVDKKKCLKRASKKGFSTSFLLVTALESWSKYTTLSFRHLDLDLPYLSSQANFFQCGISWHYLLFLSCYCSTSLHQDN